MRTWPGAKRTASRSRRGPQCRRSSSGTVAGPPFAAWPAQAAPTTGCGFGRRARRGIGRRRRAAQVVSSMKLAVGDVVVYGAHGAGTSRRARCAVQANSRRWSWSRSPAACRCSFRCAGAGTTAAGHRRGRHATIEQVLCATPSVSSDSWLKRRRDAEAKLRDAVGLAEIIRDGNGRETAPVRGPARSSLPASATSCAGEGPAHEGDRARTRRPGCGRRSVDRRTTRRQRMTREPGLACFSVVRE